MGLVENTDGKIVPAPTPLLVFKARCFLVIVDLQGGDLAAAQADCDRCREDQKANFANDKVQAATLRLLDYRILAMKADQVAEGAEKTAANSAAAAALGQLMADFPSLRDVISQQLASRMPGNADLAKIDPMLLEAMVELGRQIVMRRQRMRAGWARLCAAPGGVGGNGGAVSGGEFGGGTGDGCVIADGDF